MAQVADALGVVSVVGDTVQRGIVVLGVGSEHAAAPIGQQPVRVVHLGHEFRPAASLFTFRDVRDLDDLTGEHQQSVEVDQFGEGDSLPH